VGFPSVRTGALSVRQAEQAHQAGMQCVQELTLLDMGAPPRFDRPAVRAKRARSGDLERLAAIDEAAFGTRWCLDASMLADVRGATPLHRARVVTDPRSPDTIAGFLISGRAGRIGYVQRLAVHPDAQRRGLASALLVDGLRWLRRARVQRVFVNTHVENEAALELYRAHGFNAMDDRLRVFEGPVPL
jgi:ribosomal protein S18 acetylase RimI-like enzyme